MQQNPKTNKMKLHINSLRATKVSTLLMIMLMCSCASKKNVVYFQDEPITSIIKKQDFVLSFKTNDLLTIRVSALDPTVARPFNLEAVSTNTSVIDAQGSLKMQTYLIDADGNIEFPVLGLIKLGGLTRSDANSFLKEKLSEYIKNPIVNIRLANFTITVLGDVNNPGTFTVQDERISITEALGLAGDLTIYGRRDNIMLIREVNGEKRFAKYDLSSINIVNDPYYYLSQNDVIYVEPNKSKIRSSNYSQNNGVLISAIGTLATIIAILIK